MKIVIQCAGTKEPDAGYLTGQDGRRVLFVARPEKAPQSDGYIYARPDDLADEDGRTWRQILTEYNRREEGNPLQLSPAYKLYKPGIYEILVKRFGVDNVYILSAGWGLIGAVFLTPMYDITFSSSAEGYKRRKKSDAYDDLCMLPGNSDDDLFFFGGKDYLALFLATTQNYAGRRIVFYNSIHQPNIPAGIELRRYETKAKTNWHYSCAKDFAVGKIRI